MIYSMIAYALSSVVLTFLIQPMMASYMDGDQYGLFLTLISIIRLCVNIAISPLVNLRLILNNKYLKLGYKGDFSILLMISILISSIIVIVLYVLYNNKINIIDIISCLIILYLIMLHDYYSVHYRIYFEFKKIMIDNILIVVGYLLGFLIFYITKSWQYIFITGYGIGIIYVILTSNSWKEPLKKTIFFKNTAYQYVQLTSSSAISSSLNYCDRIIMYPILGGNSVSIYNAASVVGKAIQLISVPIERVLLSYISKNNKWNKKISYIFITIVIVIFIMIYIIMYFLSDFLILIMYPTYYESAKNFIWIVLLSVNLNTMASVINLIILNYSNKSLQIIISGIQLLSYLGVSLLSVSNYGLFGFCMAALLSSIVRLLMIIIYYFKIS